MSSCSSTRYLEENQQLIRKVSIEGVDRQFSEQARLYLSRDILPTPRFNLALYNLFNTKNGRYRVDRVRNIGQAPNLLDSNLVEISRRELEKFLFDKGFFRAVVKSDVQIRKKKAYIAFAANPGPSFKVRKFEYIIADSTVRELYTRNRASFTQISEGTRYDGDSLRNESRQVFNLLQRNGYFDYKLQYLRFSVDTNLYASAANITMTVDNPVNESGHKVYGINDVSVIIKNSNGQTATAPRTSVVDSTYFFRDYSKRFDAADVLRYNYIKEGDLYNIEKKNLTYDRFFNLNVFKSVRIDYLKTPDSLNLNATIEAVPMKRLSNRVEGEYTFNSGRKGFNFANTYTNRNVFGGAEQLDFRVRYGLLFDKALKGSWADRILNEDIQFGINLSFPRLLVPFKTAKLGRVALPRTTLASSLQFFDQLNAFKSRLIINSITYDWAESRTKLHALTPINVEYRKGILTPEFRQDLEKEGYSLYIRTNDRKYFNLGTLYTFTLNAIKLTSFENFIYFRSANDFGGNTLSLLARNLTKNNTVFGLDYLQYAKTEADVRIYRSLGGERQFVFRFNPGLAYPKRNTELPFEKNFYAGGSTGIRAWQARTLGPGNYTRADLETPEIRRQLTTLDQLGEVKLESNLEYRFKMLDNFFGMKVRGAVFTDFGNVWRLRATPNNREGEIRLDRLFDQLAIGSGGGLRIDLEYFVFRVDIGVKVKDPQFDGADQWVIGKMFDKSFKDEYKISNAPESYRFHQINFGIGMPF